MNAYWYSTGGIQTFVGLTRGRTLVKITKSLVFLLLFCPCSSSTLP